MDIDLLAKMVKEVIMDQDSVTLPGVGSFVAELVPASFADKGYTIHPPYRRLYFSPKQGSDTALVGMYARSNKISEEDATRILVDFLSEMKEVLKVRKTIVFPGLGRLRATRENHFFFVADEELDIYPAGFGLGPISLKTHEETKEEVEEAVASLAEMLEPEPAAAPEPVVVPEPVAEPVLEPEPVVVPEPVAESEPEPVAEPVREPEPVAETVQESEPEPVAEPEEEPVELVTLADMPEEPAVEAVVSESKEVSELKPEPAPEPAPEPEPEAEPEPAPAPEPEPEAEPEPAPAPEPVPEVAHAVEESPVEPVSGPSFWKVFLRVLLVVGIVAVVALIALAVVGRMAPEWLDALLYSPEEFEILHN